MMQEDVQRMVADLLRQALRQDLSRTYSSNSCGKAQELPITSTFSLKPFGTTCDLKTP